MPLSLIPPRQSRCSQAHRTVRGEPMSQNKTTVETYLDGFRKNDHTQILSCLTDDIEWTVFGASHLTGKQGLRQRDRGAGIRRPAEVGGGPDGRGRQRRDGRAHGSRYALARGELISRRRCTRGNAGGNTTGHLPRCGLRTRRSSRPASTIPDPWSALCCPPAFDGLPSEVIDDRYRSAATGAPRSSSVSASEDITAENIG